MLKNGRRDEAGIALLIIGVVLAVVASLLPAIQVTGRSGQVALNSWQAMPILSAAQVMALAALLASAFLAGLQKWRALIAVVAIAMVFLPGLSAFTMGIYAWSELRAQLVQLSGERQPFVNPGLAHPVLVAAACLIGYAAWRLETLGQPAEEVAPPLPEAANSAESPLAAAA
jgi:hypothetical protein